jgi:hypothetical protein
MIKIHASEGLDHPVTLEQTSKTLFTVTYGAQVTHKLSLYGALKEFNECIKHSAVCAGSIQCIASIFKD